MLRPALLVLALLATVGLPFLLRPRDSLLADADETLVIISPHNEAIRYEFARGFRDWYQARTGRTVRLDWRTPGGTTEIARFLASEYQAPFENLWRHKAKMHWEPDIARSFDDPRIKPGPDPAKDTDPQMARRAFLESDIGIGVDLLFGGGSFDFNQQAAAGRLVDSGFVRAHPELFDGASGIPLALGGEPFRARDGTWIGTVLSAFGICYNLDGMRRVAERAAAESDPAHQGEVRGAVAQPTRWDDLADPACLGEVALADPNKSGSVAKAFEMIIQQQIAQRLFEPLRLSSFARNAGPDGQPASALALPLPDNARGYQAAIAPPPEVERQAVSDGWDEGLRLIQRMGANTRYFTDAATRIPIDVADGDAALGMAIDYYGRFEAEAHRNPVTGQERMHYFNPVGGTSIGVDPIGLLRGAPHRALALAFMEYVMSIDGQKLWDFRVGTPGGPRQYALRRQPIRRELYGPEFNTYRSDSGVYPYEEARSFTYHPEWTGPLFGPIRFIVRVMCIDPHDEARAAWMALIAAHFPPEAMSAFEDVSAVAYGPAKRTIGDALRDPDKLVETRLAADLTDRFRAQYRRARELALAGR